MTLSSSIVAIGVLGNMWRIKNKLYIMNSKTNTNNSNSTAKWHCFMINNLSLRGSMNIWCDSNLRGWSGLWVCTVMSGTVSWCKPHIFSAPVTLKVYFELVHLSIYAHLETHKVQPTHLIPLSNLPNSQTAEALQKMASSLSCPWRTCLCRLWLEQRQNRIIKAKSHHSGSSAHVPLVWAKMNTGCLI